MFPFETSYRVLMTALPLYGQYVAYLLRGL